LPILRHATDGQKNQIRRIKGKGEKIFSPIEEESCVFKVLLKSLANIADGEIIAPMSNRFTGLLPNMLVRVQMWTSIKRRTLPLCQGE
jgi:hypothetical protein